MKNVVFWDVKPCGSCNNQHFGGTYHLHHQGSTCSTLRRNTKYYTELHCRLLQLLVRANVVPSSPTVVTPMMEERRCSETSVPTRATRRHIPEGAIVLSPNSLSPGPWEVDYPNTSTQQTILEGPTYDTWDIRGARARGLLHCAEGS
jgi:hypothetical protein